MQKRFNMSLWAGFLVILAGLFSYAFFLRFPSTRDFPWVNLLMFLVGEVLLILGIVRAFRRPAEFRGKIVGPILEALGALAIGFFAFGVFVHARDLPRSESAPRVGEKAPDFTLPDKEGRPVTFSSLLTSPTGAAKTRAVLLIFYRGYW